MRDHNLVSVLHAILNYMYSSLLQFLSRNVVAESTQAKINAIFYYLHFITTGGAVKTLQPKI